MYEFFRTCVAVDPHYGHTAFSGVMVDASATNNLQAEIAALTLRLVALEGA